MQPLVVLAQSTAPVCNDGGGVCRWLYDVTGNVFLAETLDKVVPPLLRIAVVLVVAWIAIGIARSVIRRIAERAKAGDASARLRSLTGGRLATPVNPRKVQRVDALVAVVGSITAVAVWSIAVMMILGSFGIDLGPLIAGAGILGVAIGFGAQNLVADFLSGMFMLAEDQFGVGDVIDAGDASGVVEGISLRTTRIRDVTGTLWHVPNGEIRRVGNMSQEWARALLDIGVSYGTDIDQAAGVIKEVADGMASEEDYSEKFLDAPEIWGVQNLGADSVDIRLVIKTKPGEQWGIGRELRRRIKMALDEADIEIPFPQRTVWLRTDATGTARPVLEVADGEPS
jgi:small conductance mechanosensitive channel